MGPGPERCEDGKGLGMSSWMGWELWFLPKSQELGSPLGMLPPNSLFLGVRGVFAAGQAGAGIPKTFPSPGGIPESLWWRSQGSAGSLEPSKSINKSITLIPGHIHHLWRLLGFQESETKPTQAVQTDSVPLVGGSRGGKTQ